MNYRNSSDSQSVGILFQRYSHLISAVVVKYSNKPSEVEDTVMEVFEILMNDLKQYEIKNFPAWLYSITKHYCLKKKQQDRCYESIDEYRAAASKMILELHEDNASEIQALEEKHLLKLGDAINSLSNEQKCCIELYYLDSKSYKEVADVTGYSLNQVKSYLQNGKRNLQNYFIGLS